MVWSSFWIRSRSCSSVISPIWLALMVTSFGISAATALRKSCGFFSISAWIAAAPGSPRPKACPPERARRAWCAPPCVHAAGDRPCPIRTRQKAPGLRVLGRFACHGFCSRQAPRPVAAAAALARSPSAPRSGTSPLLERLRAVANRQAPCALAAEGARSVTAGHRKLRMSRLMSRLRT